MSKDSEILVKRAKQAVLRMVYRAGASHVGSCFSAIDIISVLYADILRVDPTQPDWPKRDRFILSKGHAAAAIYSVLAFKGFFPENWLENYCQDGAKLGGHATHHGIPGLEVSTGSLGHGLPIGCGMALAAKRDETGVRTFVLISDGECDEGSTWEASLLAPQHNLDNLIVILDYNKIQSIDRVKDVIDLEPLRAKWESFRWSVQEVDGHDHQALAAAFSKIPSVQGKPSLIIAHTIKGKGVSFMQDSIAWHYKSPTAEELALALAELEK